MEVLRVNGSLTVSCFSFVSVVAIDWQSKGREFEPPQLHQNLKLKRPHYVDCC